MVVAERYVMNILDSILVLVIKGLDDMVGDVLVGITMNDI